MSQSQSPVVTIKHCEIVGVWNYNTEQIVCSICKNQLTEKCVECLGHQTNVLEQTCSVSKGKCGHAFHSHCISKLVKNSGSCPDDHTPWHYEFDDMNRTGSIRSRK